MKDINSITESISIIVLFIYLLYEKISKKIKERKSIKKDNPAFSLERSNIVYYYLHELEHHYGAARVWYARFHNGGKYNDGESKQSYSITHLVRNRKIVPYPIGYPYRYENVSVQVAHELVYELIQNKEVFKKRNDFEEGGYWHQMLMLNDVTDIMTALVCSGDRHLGFIGITWTSQMKIRKEITTDFVREVASDLAAELMSNKSGGHSYDNKKYY